MVDSVKISPFHWGGSKWERGGVFETWSLHSLVVWRSRSAWAQKGYWDRYRRSAERNERDENWEVTITKTTVCKKVNITMHAVLSSFYGLLHVVDATEFLFFEKPINSLFCAACPNKHHIDMFYMHQCPLQDQDFLNQYKYPKARLSTPRILSSPVKTSIPKLMPTSLVEISTDLCSQIPLFGKQYL